MNSVTLSLWVLSAYLFASISWAFTLVKLRRGLDLRTVGSGNLGATNASRILGAKGGIAIYALDMAKGLIPTLVGRDFLGDPPLLHGALPLSLAMGGAAIVGHCFPFYFGFKGGKGVATGSGVVFALAPLPALCAIAVFVLVVATSRLVSLGSIAAAISLPLSFAVIEDGAWGQVEKRGLLIFLLTIAALVVALHHSNIRRILRGQEQRLGRNKA